MIRAPSRPTDRHQPYRVTSFAPAARLFGCAPVLLSDLKGTLQLHLGICAARGGSFSCSYDGFAISFAATSYVRRGGMNECLGVLMRVWRVRPCFFWAR